MRRGMARGRRRTPALGAAAVGTAVVATGVLAASTAAARTGRVSPLEERVFRAFNDAPDALHLAIWPVMQMGSLGAVFATAAGVHRRTRDPHLTAVVAVGGIAAWGGIKLVKPFVARGRPASLLDDVRVRGHAQSGLGYPSGHAAVSVTLALLAAPSPAAGAVSLAAAALTGLSRIYVGAHLPLDVVGGVAAGTLAGIVGRRSARARNAVGSPG